MNRLFIRFYNGLVDVANRFQSLFLLAVRLYWGWQFFDTGKGKLENPAKVAEYFTSLHIPFPYPQAIFVGLVETVGGLLLLIGLGSRLISIPLAGTLVVAYLTADSDLVKNIFNDPDKFTGATEFLFLFAVLLILFFGPGIFSVDHILAKRFGRRRWE
jgi:putative oxidoreductase